MKYVTFYAPSHPWEGRYLDSCVSSVPPGDVLVVSHNYVVLESAVLMQEIGMNAIMEKRELSDSFLDIVFTSLALMLSYLKSSSVFGKLIIL
jgi:hypothetical protein